VVSDRAHQAQAFITYVPVWGERPGVLHDLTRKRPTAAVGALELCNAVALDRFIAEGMPFLHFGFTPFIVEPEAGGWGANPERDGNVGQFCCLDGETFELGPGGLCHVEATTPRQVWNAAPDCAQLRRNSSSNGARPWPSPALQHCSTSRARASKTGSTTTAPPSSARSS
jgi:hypothetical protein